jgi:uncharacterized protein YjiS (DUF1127 family)
MTIQMTAPRRGVYFGRALVGLKWAVGAPTWSASWPLRLVRFWRKRHELSALAVMSGYELRDIGLTPFDVANAMESLSAEDATQALARVVQDRRFKRES